MPFKFIWLCNLLESLEVIALRDQTRKSKTKTIKQQSEDAVKQWFETHKECVDSLGSASAVALLSSLLPERRPDRVYSIQTPKLSKILGRCLGLGRTRLVDLMLWEKPGHGDLGACVQRVFAQAEFPLSLTEISVEEIHRALGEIAEKNRFSAPQIRALRREDSGPDRDILKLVYLQLQSREAKWFTRLVLKNFATLEVPENLVLRLFDRRLPVLLRLQSDLEVALSTIKAPSADLIGNPQRSTVVNQSFIKQNDIFKPQIGVQVGRDFYHKARSVRHIIETADRRTMVLEKKYDGEFCQIHIDLDKKQNWIKIYSKNGRDSTQDRINVHDTLRTCLRIDEHFGRSFSKRCILEGELVVWSDRDEKILEFHKLRKHVSRGGSFIGTEEYSQAHKHEHLMIIFFDVLLVDEDSLLQQPFSSRIATLRKAVATIPGRADFAQQEVIDFSCSNAADKLLVTLANGFAQRWEGFVMKPLHAPRINIASMLGGDYSHRWMKIKRQAIPGLGDVADLVVLGAGYGVSKGALGKIKGCQYTHFQVGCLKNKEEVLHHAARPQFLILDDVLSQDMAKPILKFLHDFGQFEAMAFSDPKYPADIKDLRISSGRVKVNVVFKNPFVCEMLGFGVERPPSRAHYTLRFARIVKVHSDRDFKDTMSFQELQQMATDLLTVPNAESLSREVSEWKKKLRRVDRGQKRALACWESSQRQDSDVEDIESESKSSDEDPSASSRVNRRRARGLQRLASVNMVRMDTAEMAPGEQRMADGAVSSKPLSQYSAVTTISESSVPTPPTSSPGRASYLDGEQPPDRPTAATQASHRKRTMFESDAEDDARRFKKVRRIMLENASRQSTRRLQLPLDSAANKKVLPLKEVMNTYSSHQQLMRRNEGSPASTLALDLIRKVPPKPLIKPLSRRIMKKGPANNEPPSSQTSTPSCQSALQPSSLPRPKASQGAPTSSTPISHSAPSEVFKPPDHYEPTRPNLATAHILLSPCVAGFPYITENLLPPTCTQIALPTPPTPLPLLNLSDLPFPTQIVLLVESARTHINGPLVGALMPAVIASGREIEIWDWRLCGVGEGHGWEEAYLGRMWRDGEGVRVRFGGGMVRWVGKSRVEERLRRV